MNINHLQQEQPLNSHSHTGFELPSQITKPLISYSLILSLLLTKIYFFLVSISRRVCTKLASFALDFFNQILNQL